MKVILLSDVKNVGKKDQVVEVAHGYAMNFLIKNKLAVAATKTSLSILQNEEIEKQKNIELEHEKALALKDKLGEIEVKIPMKVGKDGRVFGSVSLKQVVDALDKQHQIKIDKRKFQTHSSMNTLGFHQLRVELAKNVEGVVKVHVVEQK